MDRTWTRTVSPSSHARRTAERQLVRLPARLAWKDRRGIARVASVVTRDISETGVFVECETPVSIPLYRLVQFQLEREARDSSLAPPALRRGRILSAVYRVASPRPGSGHGFALRLMVEPRRLSAQSDRVRTEVRATA